MPHASLPRMALPSDACAGSVLTTHDYIANVQKRLGKRAWTGFGECRLCGSFLDPQLEHGEICSPAEATRGHHACVRAVVCGLKLADTGITTGPRGLTASQSRPADIFTTTAVPGRSAALDVCVWPPPTQQQLEETQRKCRLIGNFPIAGMKSQTCVTRSFTSDLLSRRLTGDHNLPLSLQYAADIASSRNGQQMSATSLQRRWKHEIQMALLRRRAASTRARAE